MLTITEAIDMAYDLPHVTRRQRRIFKRRCQRSGYRTKYAEEIRDALLGDDRLALCLPLASMDAMDDDDFDVGNTLLAVDPEKLRKLLDLILEYAPRFIDLVLTIMGLFGTVLLATGTVVEAAANVAGALYTLAV